MKGIDLIRLLVDTDATQHEVLVLEEFDTTRWKITDVVQGDTGKIHIWVTQDYGD